MMQNIYHTGTLAYTCLNTVGENLFGTFKKYGWILKFLLLVFEILWWSPSTLSLFHIVTLQHMLDFLFITEML